MIERRTVIGGSGQVHIVDCPTWHKEDLMLVSRCTTCIYWYGTRLMGVISDVLIDTMTGKVAKAVRCAHRDPAPQTEKGPTCREVCQHLEAIDMQAVNTWEELVWLKHQARRALEQEGGGR